MLTCDLSNSNSILGSGWEVHMVRSDSGSQSQLEVLGLGHALWGQVARVEWGSDAAQHIWVRQHAVGSCWNSEELANSQG